MLRKRIRERVTPTTSVSPERFFSGVTLAQTYSYGKLLDTRSFWTPPWLTWFGHDWPDNDPSFYILTVFIMTTSTTFLFHRIFLCGYVLSRSPKHRGPDHLRIFFDNSFWFCLTNLFFFLPFCTLTKYSQRIHPQRDWDITVVSLMWYVIHRLSNTSML